MQSDVKPCANALQFPGRAQQSVLRLVELRDAFEVIEPRACEFLLCLNRFQHDADAKFTPLLRELQCLLRRGQGSLCRGQLIAQRVHTRGGTPPRARISSAKFLAGRWPNFEPRASRMLAIEVKQTPRSNPP